MTSLTSAGPSTSPPECDFREASWARLRIRGDGVRARRELRRERLDPALRDLAEQALTEWMEVRAAYARAARQEAQGRARRSGRDAREGVRAAPFGHLARLLRLASGVHSGASFAAAEAASDSELASQVRDAVARLADVQLEYLQLLSGSGDNVRLALLEHRIAQGREALRRSLAPGSLMEPIGAKQGEGEGEVGGVFQLARVLACLSGSLLDPPASP